MYKPLINSLTLNTFVSLSKVASGHHVLDHLVVDAGVYTGCCGLVLLAYDGLSEGGGGLLLIDSRG